MEEFTGFPILDENQKLVGIFTSRDLKYLDDHEKQVSEAMTTDLITAPAGTTLKEAYDIMVKNRVGKLPLLDDKGAIAGLYSFHDVNSLIGSDEPDGVSRDECDDITVAIQHRVEDEVQSRATSDIVNLSADRIVKSAKVLPRQGACH